MENTLSTETHFYDGKLGLQLPEWYSKATDAQWENILLWFEKKGLELFPELSGSLNASLNVLRNRDGNYDSTDNVNAEPLLVAIKEKLEKEGAEKDHYYIFEQIADISQMGSCPQGRTKRIYQAYSCLFPIS